ncbi:hypothetical protein QUB10_26385 [Microcoleus sp. B5-D4]|uniref:hypothetical protein n=1 Tax=unclassified Microcoleus TaxID=2642155 RepID=UPI002FD29834
MHAFCVRTYLLFRALKSLRLTSPPDIKSGCIVLVCPGSLCLTIASSGIANDRYPSIDRATGLDYDLP